MAQSDRSNSVWHNDIIITWHSWLVLSCIGSQWAHCLTFKYMTSACCISCSVLQTPSTFPSSTCIDLLQGDSCMLYGGYLMYVIFAAAEFLTCSQQHVVDVLAIASLGACSAAAAAAAADLFRQTKYIKGDLLCKNNFYKVFEHSCVAAVCENNQPIMLKIHQLIFL